MLNTNSAITFSPRTSSNPNENLHKQPQQHSPACETSVVTVIVIVIDYVLLSHTPFTNFLHICNLLFRASSRTNAPTYSKHLLAPHCSNRRKWSPSRTSLSIVLSFSLPYSAGPQDLSIHKQHTLWGCDIKVRTAVRSMLMEMVSTEHKMESTTIFLITSRMNWTVPVHLLLSFPKKILKIPLNDMF